MKSNMIVVDGCLCRFCQHGSFLKMIELGTVRDHHMHQSQLLIMV